MKKAHTQAQKANRQQDVRQITKGFNQWYLSALFGKKQFSQSTKNGQNIKQAPIPYLGQKLGKQFAQRRT
jgi:hypothetical protein